MSRNRIDREWQVLRKELPRGWKEVARQARAIRREQGPLADPERLLRVVLGRAASNRSYRHVAAHARGSGLCAVSDVALLERERQCGDWLEWIANRILDQTLAQLPDSPLRLRLVDATCASKPGSRGTDFRLHVNMELPGRRFTRMELTDARGGESFKRLAIAPGDLVVGDRAYGTREGIAHVTLHGGYVLVRVNGSSLPMWAPDGSRVDPLMLARALGPGQSYEVPVEIRPPTGAPIMGRLCLLHLPAEQARKAQQAVRRNKSKRPKRPGRRAVESAKYVFLFTTVPVHLMSTGQAFAIYRLRWQVELAFKTLKTVLHYGELPNRLPDTGRTWLLAKLVCALLLDRLAHPRGAFPPSASRAAA